MKIPKSFYIYEFSYPEGMPEGKGAIFYVGKGTHVVRMDDHFREAMNGCECNKCQAIRSVWDAGLTVVRRIVFESTSEMDTLNEERRRILQHQSPFLTNIQRTTKVLVEKPDETPDEWELVYHISPVFRGWRYRQKGTSDVYTSTLDMKEIAEARKNPLQISYCYGPAVRMQGDIEPTVTHISSSEIRTRFITEKERNLLGLPEITPATSLFDVIRDENNRFYMAQEIVLSPRTTLIFDFPFTNRP